MLSPNCDVTSNDSGFFPENALGDGPKNSRIRIKAKSEWSTEYILRSVNDFLKNTADFPMQFDESLLFQDERAENLKNEFRIRFKNVTSIIDCAACEKCRLWGKLQTHGLGTALKVCV